MPTIEDIKAVACKLGSKYGAESIYLFGSYARGDQREDSDIDLRLNKGAIRGLQIGGLYSDFSDSLNKPVDLLETASLDDYFLSQIKNEEVLLYARA